MDAHIEAELQLLREDNEALRFANLSFGQLAERLAERVHKLERLLAEMTTAAPAVLLVDPYDDAREMYVQYLASCGFKTTAVEGGDEALSKIAAADVVVTGINIHGSFDGLELLRRIRSEDAGKPVIVLTAHADETYRLRAQQAGCDAFLTKPCRPNVLTAQICGLLARSGELRERTRQLHARAANVINRSNLL